MIAQLEANDRVADLGSDPCPGKLPVSKPKFADTSPEDCDLVNSNQLYQLADK